MATVIWPPTVRETDGIVFNIININESVNAFGN